MNPQPAKVTGNRKKDVGKLVGVGAALLLALVVARITGLSEYVSSDSLNRLRDWIDGFGVVAPIVFIAVYIVATVAFVPGTPLSLLAGLAFGAVWGTLWTVIGATLGATLAFLIGRYATRGLVEAWAADNPRIRTLDRGVEKHGLRMLLVTRLVPLFPFNLQNYAYGLTRVGVGTYVLLTGVGIVPGVLVYTFAGGSLASAREDLTRTFAYLGVAAVVFVLISLIPGWLVRKSGH
jgi:uncharacterized membrane protein YdjX (TVP38/TMEM64 family)